MARWWRTGLWLVLACGGGEATDDAAGDAGDKGDVQVEVATTAEARDGTLGWHVLGPDFGDDGALDGISFEWDYFMIHDEAAGFTGSIGYLIANPRQRDDLFGNQVPKGGNVAVAGRFDDGARVAEYRNFGYAGFAAGADARTFEASDEASGEWARLRPVAGQNALRLTGRTASLDWDLTVTPGWPALNTGADTFRAVTGTDVGAMRPAEERWNVDMLWPYTRVTGTLTERASGRQTALDGHGYRENSWGRWAFNLGGWDFAVVGDRAAGVQWAWQTYHFESQALDYLDLGVEVDGALVLKSFHAAQGQLGWRHDAWRWDPAARQCVPEHAFVVADDGQWRVEATVTVDGASEPMLSDATAATSAYVIFILFPRVSGTVTDKATGQAIATFQGLGGGEFATARETPTAPARDAAACAAWGQVYASPLP